MKLILLLGLLCIVLSFGLYEKKKSENQDVIELKFYHSELKAYRDSQLVGKKLKTEKINLKSKYHYIDGADVYTITLQKAP